MCCDDAIRSLIGLVDGEEFFFYGDVVMSVRKVGFAVVFWILWELGCRVLLSFDKENVLLDYYIEL